MAFELRPVPKPSAKKKVGTQRQRGNISTNVDEELKERSRGICELCGEEWATERAHLTGRRHIDHKTAVTDLLHLCTRCHDWLDETPEGIRARRFIATAINHVLSRGNAQWQSGG